MSLQKICPSFNPRSLCMWAYLDRIFAGVIKWRISRWDHRGFGWALNLTTGVVERMEKEIRDPETQKGRPCEDRWRLEWAKPRDMDDCWHPVKAGRQAWKRLSLWDSRENSPTDNSILNFWLPGLWENKATKFLVIYYSSPRKLVHSLKYGYAPYAQNVLKS